MSDDKFISERLGGLGETEAGAASNTSRKLTEDSREA
jgi:hypothetical protein